MYKEITDVNFKEEILQSEKPFLVFFKSEWCPRCEKLASIIEDLRSEYSSRLNIGVYDIVKNGKIAIDYAIRTVPTLLLIKEKKLVKQFDVLVPKKELKQSLDNLFISVKN